MDIIFSLDSILTTSGLTQELTIMIIAEIISLVIVMTFAVKIANFIERHPSMEVLDLSFLILIGFMLVLDAVGKHVPKGYIYFAVFFSLVVEILNKNVSKISRAVKLHKRINEDC